MRHCRPRQLAAWCLAAALLAATAGAGAVNPLACASEPACAAQGCVGAYARNASTFPYSMGYTTTQDATSTTIIWMVCSQPCAAAAPLCRPLRSLQLRLADRFLADPSSIKALPTGAVLTQACSPRGPGLLLGAAQLKSLATVDPSKDKACELFRTTLASSSQLALQDVCQQGVTLVDRQGATVYSQPPAEPSCLYIAELADGASGFSTFASKTPNPPPSPGFPSPSPVPPPSSPQPPVSPPPSPQPYSPSPQPYSPSPQPYSPGPTPYGPGPAFPIPGQQRR